ncbi:MAG: carbohydrate-binding protein [Phycisphaerae bacterium]
MRRWLAVGLSLVTAAWAVPAGRAENVHFTYLWHMEQPIYWPDRQVSGADRYERAWQSILRTDGGAAHPANNLREIFGKDDRVAAYQYRVRDCINAIHWSSEAGAQVSYSGGLIENIASLGDVSQLGYSPTWYGGYREARNWLTTGGQTRLDIVVFPFHHPLLPLCDESTVRKEIQLYQQVYADAWGASPTRSRGLFPPEMAFSERPIKVLAEEGLDWVVVSNEHISRACENFPVMLGTGGVNCDPPNAADQLNPPQSDWLRIQIDRGCSPANAYPLAYTPHYARYVDPDTGDEYRVVVVPAAQALGWQDGYAPLGLTHFGTLATQNPASRPQLVLLAHDGDNAWGGGYSYYLEAVPNFVSSASGAGYVATTIEQYLANHPVPAGDVVHVEDGAWVNADGDFGSPVFLNWNWPLVNSSGQIDIAGGWAEDERNWAVITAAQNHVDTAEQIAGGVNVAKILYPDASTTNAERAWHYFLAGLNSGFMYYGTALDHEVKATIACNLAVSYADAVIGDGSADETPPTVWLPQRHPWNPGSLNFGPQYGYQQYQDDGDFWVWTFVHDVSGLTSVTLLYRLDDDGAIGDANQTYAGGAGVGTWQALPMTQRSFPTGNFFNDPNIDFFVLPTYIADEYYVEVTGVREALVDYYVEAEDGRGNVRRSPLQHVWVGDGSGGGGGDTVIIDPDPPQAGSPVTIQYDATGRPLAGAAQVYLHYGFNGWNPVMSPDPLMSWSEAAQAWVVTVSVASTATQLDFVFHDGNNNWENNNGADWHFAVTGGGPGDEWVMDGQLDADAVLVAENYGLELYAGVKGTQLYVAAPDAGEGNDHFIFVADDPGGLVAAPWAKSGQVAAWSAYLADENDNDYCGWFDLAGGAFGEAATGPNGGWLEGTFDLTGEFGNAPQVIYLAFAPYATADGSGLVPVAQVPASVNDDGNVDAAEYAVFTLGLPGDVNCDGVVNNFDISPFVLALTDAAGYAAAYPDCDRGRADCNGDGQVNNFDISAFVTLLTGR